MIKFPDSKLDSSTILKSKVRKTMQKIVENKIMEDRVQLKESDCNYANQFVNQFAIISE